MTVAPALDRIALISDVHGNLGALQAVLADIDARGITRIFNLGDNVGKGPRGREVVDLVRERCEVNVRGNWDEHLPDPVFAAASEEMRWWRAQLGPGQAEWLAALPFSHDLLLSGRRVRMFHASQVSVHHRVHYRHSEADFLGMFTNSAATGAGPTPDVVVYADIHDPFHETGHRRRTLVNTGSVGNCLGDPTPVYVVLEGVLDSSADAPFAVTFHRIPYDVEAELAVAREVGMPAHDGWALELREGVYRANLHHPGPVPYLHRARLS